MMSGEYDKIDEALQITVKKDLVGTNIGSLIVEEEER